MVHKGRFRLVLLKSFGDCGRSIRNLSSCFSSDGGWKKRHRRTLCSPLHRTPKIIGASHSAAASTSQDKKEPAVDLGGPHHRNYL